MTLEGIDYSSGRMSAATARANGLSFICRYVSTPGSWKNLTSEEVADWSANGIGIVVVFERKAQNALGGAARGRSDAESAQAQLVSLDLPEAPVYFAVDFDAGEAQLAVIGDYLTGAGEVIGLNRTGVYGSRRVVGYALDNQLVTYAWQTYAWSHGALDDRAHLYQYHNGDTIAGISVDRDRTVSSDVDYGQAPVPGATTVPVVSGIVPSTGDAAGGTVVTITGSGFTGATDVGFGPTNAADMTVASDTEITATSPAGEGTVAVTVVTPAGSSEETADAQFTYEASATWVPVVSWLTPSVGDPAGGTVVAIVGSGFTGATDVGFGPTNAADMTVESDTEITATSPAGEGTVAVTVVTPAGTSEETADAQFTFE